MFFRSVFFLATMLNLSACDDSGGRADGAIIDRDDRPPSAFSEVLTGADVLVQSGFQELKGMRVGLIVNHTSRSNGRHLIDLMHESSNVTIAALFGPEHGIRGDEDAGAKIADGIDDATGAPVYSLYGENRSPTPEMLRGVDALVFDIQDVGSRFYTFISTMGLAMKSAAQAGIPFYVLDRPNPLGGVTMEGNVLDTTLVSFVGQYPIPTRYGLTAGELSQMILGEAWIPDLGYMDLQIIEMTGWHRDMLWPDTGMEWIPSSPNIPTFESALMYAGTCFFEATSASEGRGTPAPFLTVGAPWMDASGLTALDFPGLAIEAIQITPISIPGKSTYPKWENVPLNAVSISVMQPDQVRSVGAGLELISRTYAQLPDSVITTFFNESWMAKLSGSHETVSALKKGWSARDFEAAWAQELADFDQKRQKYLLYD